MIALIRNNEQATRIRHNIAPDTTLFFRMTDSAESGLQLHLALLQRPPSCAADRVGVGERWGGGQGRGLRIAEKGFGF